MAERLARIANISLDELGKTLFSNTVDHKSVEEMLFTDYKEFHVADLLHESGRRAVGFLS